MSWSPPPESFGEFLLESLERMRTHVPAAYRSLVGLLPEPLSLKVGDEHLTLARDDAALVLRPGTPRELHLETSPDTLLELVDGHFTLAEGVRTDGLRLFGTATALAKLDEALRTYWAGAVRVRSMSGLLDSYRRSVRRQTGGGIS